MFIRDEINELKLQRMVLRKMCLKAENKCKVALPSEKKELGAELRIRQDEMERLLHKKDLEINAVVERNCELKTAIDALSAENGRLKRKMKRVT